MITSIFKCLVHIVNIELNKLFVFILRNNNATLKSHCRTNNIKDIVYKFEITNVYPRQGSLEGGTMITITGNGFSTNASLNVVMFGDTNCKVQTSTARQLVCMVEQSGRTIKVDNQGEHPGINKFIFNDYLVYVDYFIFIFFKHFTRQGLFWFVII